MKQWLAFIMLFLIGVGMISIVAEMPTFGDVHNPAHTEMSERYLEQSVTETGSLNVVSAIISDYRAFDTLGETTVLFATVAAIYATLLAGSKSKKIVYGKEDKNDV
ncbi:hydrogen gas-evolving membrane-bound hydrogenase subunit E [Natronospora cellulosivora (SeqCode)]